MLMTQLIVSGLLIFSVFTEPRNSGKPVKSREINKNMRNTAKFARNLIKYMLLQHIWNLFWLLGLFNCHKRANLSWNFIATMNEQRPKPTRHKLCCKKLGTSHDVKSFAIGSFRELFVVKIATRSSNQHKVFDFEQNLSRKLPQNRPFFTDCFLAKLAPKISTNLPLKILRNLTTVSYQRPCSMVWSIRFDCLKISWTEVSINLEVNWLCLCDLAHFLWWKQSKIRWNVCFNFTLLI